MYNLIDFCLFFQIIMTSLNLKHICIKFIIDNNIIINKSDLPYNLFVLIRNKTNINKIKQQQKYKTIELNKIYCDISFYNNLSYFYYNLSKTNISTILELKFIIKYINFERIVQRLLKKLKIIKQDILYFKINIIKLEKIVELYK